MAEAIPYGVISSILYKLSSLAFQELGSIFKVNKELEKLQATLGTISAVLLDAEENSNSSHAVNFNTNTFDARFKTEGDRYA
ncbi:hypothetical protein PTKIN_Ptkin14bG0100800 [Pterospermum kingtungense]